MEGKLYQQYQYPSDLNRYQNNISPSINRMYSTPSPVIFPSASPTPKLYSTPSRKVAYPLTSWQETNNSGRCLADMISRQSDSTSNKRSCSFTISATTSSFIPGEKHDIRLIDNQSPLSIISSGEEDSDDFMEVIATSSSNTPNNLACSSITGVTYPTKALFISQEEQYKEVVVGSPFVPAPVDDPIEERCTYKRSK
ncbi:hypothetical protein BDF20DRAFT_876879 [Mycotypha africana]|uniref:uncharacterized protein n=1 Tax=Mycotypha africana TaxID=64632 RepID=UPI0023010F71|nr:uncharacterized protein BDF20DRAFT_876879 [Mycotypha africana]KAI8975101.1 hypothetical protein BDF20DRAFT_876879 [Mycotypha africana]